MRLTLRGAGPAKAPHPHGSPGDLAVRVVNHTKGERLRKAKEDKKRKKQQKV